MSLKPTNICYINTIPLHAKQSEQLLLKHPLHARKN